MEGSTPTLHYLNYLTNSLNIFPSMIPTPPKSASLKVVLANPRSPSTGSRNTGRKVIKRPWVKAPKTAPLLPPVALPNTPAVAPSGEQHPEE